MSERSVRVRGRGRCVRPLLVGVLLAAGTAALAEDVGGQHVSWEPRVPVGKCLSSAGTLLVNSKPGQAWQTVGEKEDVSSRDLLLALPGMRAMLETQPKAVELTLWGNLPELTKFPGLQSAVILHDSRAFDLDFTLQTGRAIVTNRKDKGPAHVWVRVEGGAFQLTLGEPGDAVYLARYGFWPRGVAFTPAPKPEDVPSQSLTFLVLKGQIDLKSGGTRHSLSAPPGPAYFHWDNTNGAEEGPRRRDTIPEWANPNSKTPPSTQSVFKVIAEYQSLVKDKEPRTALLDLLAAAGNERDKERAKVLAEFAVFGLAALNDIDRVLEALADPKQAAAREAAVVALRHWIGEAAGHDQRLYQYLVDRHNYSKPQAATVLQLLHSAFPPGEPDTYETLIAYLRHQNLAVRQLAWWQLTHLVPERLLVPYDPAGSDAERAKAYAAWKKRVPSGSVPMDKPKNK